MAQIRSFCPCDTDFSHLIFFSFFGEHHTASDLFRSDLVLASGNASESGGPDRASNVHVCEYECVPVCVCVFVWILHQHNLGVNPAAKTSFSIFSSCPVILLTMQRTCPDWTSGLPSEYSLWEEAYWVPTGLLKVALPSFTHSRLCFKLLPGNSLDAAQVSFSVCVCCYCVCVCVCVSVCVLEREREKKSEQGAAMLTFSLSVCVCGDRFLCIGVCFIT